MEQTKFKLVEQIGGGGTSEVWLAVHVDLNNRWAVKRFPENSPLTQANMHEANMLKELSHSCLPRVVDVFHMDGHVHVVMDLIEGRTLRERVDDEGPMDAADVIRIGIQLCDVLNYLHTRSPHPVIHRDLKPANIMVDKDDHLKLIDFGSSRSYRPGQIEDTVFIGTQGYCAPEQLGTAQSDARTDIYGLGVTLLALMTGKNPAEYSVEGMLRLLKEQRVRKDLLGFLEKCTRILPSARYETALAAANELNVMLKSGRCPAWINRLVGQRAGDEPDRCGERLRNGLNGSSPHKSTGCTGTVVIVVSGVMERIGTTHFALSLAKRLADRVGMTALAASTGNALSMLCRSHADDDEQSAFTRIGRLTILAEAGDDAIKRALCGGYAYLVVDLGVWEERLSSFHDSAAMSIHIRGSKPWEAEGESPQADRTLYSFSLPGSDSIPWSPSPLTPSPDLARFIDRLLGLKEGASADRKRMKADDRTSSSRWQQPQRDYRRQKSRTAPVDRTADEETPLYRLAQGTMILIANALRVAVPAALVLYFLLRGIGFDPCPELGDTIVVWIRSLYRPMRDWIVSG